MSQYVIKLFKKLQIRNPPRTQESEIADTVEQGAQRLSPFPPVEHLIQYCLKLLCEPSDAERHFVTFEENDSVVLVVNNYGGLSNLELGALTDETITQLGKMFWPQS